MPHKISLQELCEKIPSISIVRGDPLTFTKLFTGVETDLSNLRSGNLFVLVGISNGGQSGSGSRIIRGGGLVAIDEAIRLGAIGILTMTPNKAEVEDLDLKSHHPDVIWLSSQNIRLTLVDLSKSFHPQIPGFLGAVTGTNGKSSIVGFTRQLLSSLHLPGASLGTLGLNIENPPPGLLSTLSQKVNPPDLTTWDPVTLHKALNILTQAGVNHVVLEASSHGLYLDRVSGLTFDVGVFTNLDSDHLDFHGSMEHYFEAKALLFKERLRPGGTVLLSNNLTSKWRARILEIAKVRDLKVWTYGEGSGDLYYEKVTEEDGFCSWRLNLKGQTFEVDLPHFPSFQIENILGAIGIVLTSGVETNIEVIVECVKNLRSIPGRVEFIGTSKGGGRIYVDYAHTPAALTTTLTWGRSITAPKGGSLKVIFGCGGNRDLGKRRLMGSTASKLADYTFITDDNYRDEDPALIRGQILQGFNESEGAKGSRSASRVEVINEGGRREGIKKAIDSLGQGDLLIICGKGHESVQIIEGGQRIPFNDAQVVREFL